MRQDPQKSADLVTFTEGIFNGKVHFLCSAKDDYLRIEINYDHEYWQEQIE